MWENLGRTFGESFHLKEIVAEKRIRFEPKERLDEIIRGGPCVVCGLHLGNWELVAYASRFIGLPFTGVYQRLSNPLVDEETRKLRAFLYEGGLLPKTPVTARALMKAAKAGAVPYLPPTCATTTAPPFRFSAFRRFRPSFPLSSPARPACRSMPASSSASRRCVS